jgi:tetratricopeptide (TPR) repeat protein
LGDCYKFQKRFDIALKQYDEAISLSPKFYRAHLNKAEIYLKKQEIYKAMSSLNQVSYKNTYPKYSQVGMNVLQAFVQIENPERFKDLHENLSSLQGNPGEMWKQYNLWKAYAVKKANNL